MDGIVYGPTSASSVWPTAAQTAGHLRSLPVMAVVIGTDGTTAAAERARRCWTYSCPSGNRRRADADLRSDTSRLSDQYRRLADVVVLASLPIAGASLAVSVVGGLSDRVARSDCCAVRRPARDVAARRRARDLVPLLAGALAAIGSGFVAAQLFLQAQLGYPWWRRTSPTTWSSARAWWRRCAIVASTLPLLDRATDLERARDG